MVPFSPRTTMFGPMVSTMLPSIDKARLLAPVLPSTMVPMPPKVWLPANDSTLLELTLMLPFKVSPPVTRSTLVPAARSSVPLKVTPLRKLLLLLATRNEPPPAELITPLRLTPFWTTVLPAPASMWLPTAPVTLVFKTSVPPFLASRMPLLVVPELGDRSSLPPATSAEMRPLLMSDCAPPAR